MAAAGSATAWGTIFAGAVVLALGGGAPAHAQRTSSLSWVRLPGAEGCIPTQTLAERVEQRVGRPVFVSASQADLSLEGRVEPAADRGGFVATLAVSDRSGHVLGRRVLRAPGDDCSALDPALVLVIAIGIDPDAALPATRSGDQLSDDTQALLSQLELPKLDENALRELAVPDPEAVRAQEQRAREAAEREAAARAAREREREQRAAATSRNASALRRSGLQVILTLGPTAELGLLPDPAIGGTMHVVFVTPRFLPVELWATLFAPQNEAAAQTTGHGAFTFVSAGAALCLPWGASRSLEPVLCAGLRSAMLTARGSGFARDLHERSSWFDPELHGGLRLHLGADRRWLIQMLAGASVTTTRDRFVYRDDQDEQRTLHRPAPASGRIELAAGVNF